MTAQQVVIETDADPGEVRLRVVVDATITEKHSSSVELTKYPVEQGISPSDHAREAPDGLQLDGVITNTPVDAASRTSRGVTEDRGQSSGRPGCGDYANKQLSTLREMKSARGALTVFGPWRSYDSMVMTRLEYSRDAKMGDAVRFSATFEQVRFVTSQTVKLQAVKTKVPEKGAIKHEQGTLPSTKVEVTDVLKSDAAGLADTASRFFGS